LIDYCYFDVKTITPLYEFGLELGYTTFDMCSLSSIRQLEDDLSAVPDPSRAIETGGHLDLWEDVIKIETSVSNTGSKV
jgi:beta-glucosidase